MHSALRGTGGQTLSKRVDKQTPFYYIALSHQENKQPKKKNGVVSRVSLTEIVEKLKDFSNFK